MTRRCLLLVAVAGGLTAPRAVAQYPGYMGPQQGGTNGLPGGYGGNGYGGYGGYPIYPFGSAGGGLGGFGVTQSSPFAPNFYNRANQPLSPYLNLLRGGNTAVNYFYGVRPGLPSGQPIGSGLGAMTVGPSQLRVGFLPVAGNQSDEPVEMSTAGVNVSLPSSSHATIYGNKFGPLNSGGGSGRAGITGSQAPPAYNRGTGQPAALPKR